MTVGAVSLRWVARGAAGWMWLLKLLCNAAADTMWTLGPAGPEREEEEEAMDALRQLRDVDQQLQQHQRLQTQHSLPADSCRGT